MSCIIKSLQTRFRSEFRHGIGRLLAVVIMSARTTLNSPRRTYEEAKGFLSYRVADRRGDHSDHRGYRNSEPPPVPYGRERGFGSRYSPHHQYRGNNLSDDLSDGWICRNRFPRRRGCNLRNGDGCNLYVGMPD